MLTPVIDMKITGIKNTGDLYYIAYKMYRLTGLMSIYKRSYGQSIKIRSLYLFPIFFWLFCSFHWRKCRLVFWVPKSLGENLEQIKPVNLYIILLPFLSVAQHESGTRKAIFWSVTVYNKNVSSQYNLPTQIEPVQDK
jgi:hypothetical protein